MLQMLNRNRAAHVSGICFGFQSSEASGSVHKEGEAREKVGPTQSGIHRAQTLARRLSLSLEVGFRRLQNASENAALVPIRTFRTVTTP